MKKPILLCILDGIAHTNLEQGNAYFLANTPTIDHFHKTYPMSLLDASGLQVGLPQGQMGNSEVGHLNIGAGRVIYQSLTRIDQAVKQNTLKDNTELIKAFKKAKEQNGRIHFVGLFSDGGVHSHLSHLKYLVELANDHCLQTNIHAFLDGRDVSFNAGYSDLEHFTTEFENVNIASISGRYYAMDRDKRFERNQLCINALLHLDGPTFTNPLKYVSENYANETYDEFILPAYNIEVDGKIRENDVVISINFRPDRMIQLGSVLTNANYEYALSQSLNLHFLSMMPYANTVLGPVMFEKVDIINPLGVYLANNGVSQLRIAETEKYAHVTFFFDGQVKYDGIENPRLDKCDFELIESPKVATYDLKPEMSADLITQCLLQKLDENKYDFIVLNFANCDMVGHTGNLKAAVKAVEKVDDCLAQIYKKMTKLDGVMLITADHGNCEQMLDQQGNVLTNHTTNPVEFIVTKGNIKLDNGKLADIAPTICYLLGIDVPKEMDGKCLIIK